MGDRSFRTINVKIDLWRRLMRIKIEKDFSGIPEVIEASLEKNKKLRQQILELKNKEVVAQ